MKTTTTTKTPKTVSLSTLIQSLIIAVLVTGIIAATGGYMLANKLQSQARESVMADLKALPKEQAASSQK